MASGNTLAIMFAGQGVPTVTLGAGLIRRVSASTPNAQVILFAFDASTAEYVDFMGLLPQHYAGGGLTVRIVWGATTATTGNTVWRIGFRAIEDDAEDIDTSHTYDYNSATDAAPSASGEYTAAVITFTSGADMDNVDAGDPFIMRIGRDAANGSDTMSGDAELMMIEIRET